MQNHQYVNRNGYVLSKPINEKTDIEVGDEVIVHHNIFRRFYDIRGTEKNSSSYFTEDKYFCALDQVFLYKRNNKWYAPEGYCFVKPIKSTDNFDMDKEKPLIGVIKYLEKDLSNDIKYGDLVLNVPTETKLLSISLYMSPSLIVTQLSSGFLEDISPSLL